MAPHSTSAQDAAASSLDAYRVWEPQLKAFAWCDPDGVREAARKEDGYAADDRPLHGMPVGVKDIFDVAGIPTEYGSAVFEGRVASRTATAVKRLLGAGAVLFGKTVTAELAYFAPGPTTNPWNASHTPGGSSMGSAAAVAAGVVPVAIGTQTNGSVIRPAAFCGVVGFKPTFGRLPTSGVLRFSPSLDQLGVFGRSVEMCGTLAAVIADDAPAQWISPRPSRMRPRLAIVRSPDWAAAESAARAAFELSVRLLGNAGAAIVDLELPKSLADSIPVHRAIMAAEAHRWIEPLVAKSRNVVSAQLLSLLDEGTRLSATDYRRATAAKSEVTDEFTRLIDDVDAVVTLSTLGEAPLVASTGDPRCCTRWTLIGAPALTLPCALGPGGLPFGVQLVGHIGGDAELLATARWAEAVLPSIGEPPLPRG